MNEENINFERLTGFAKDLKAELNRKIPEIASEELSIVRTSLSNIRSHMSNERTQLSYLRTSLSLMTFGVTLNRFSIFLHENKQIIRGFGMLRETAYVGIGMVIVGIGILAWGLHRYKQVNFQIENNTYISSIRPMTILTFIVIFLGGLTTVWMIVRRG